eukprot:15435586-Alexandrium_andersonii.AAC.1
MLGALRNPAAGGCRMSDGVQRHSQDICAEQQGAAADRGTPRSAAMVGPRIVQDVAGWRNYS